MEKKRKPLGRRMSPSLASWSTGALNKMDVLGSGIGRNCEHPVRHPNQLPRTSSEAPTLTTSCSDIDILVDLNWAKNWAVRCFANP